MQAGAKLCQTLANLELLTKFGQANWAHKLSKTRLIYGGAPDLLSGKGGKTLLFVKAKKSCPIFPKQSDKQQRNNNTAF